MKPKKTEIFITFILCQAFLTIALLLVDNSIPHKIVTLLLGFLCLIYPVTAIIVVNYVTNHEHRENIIKQQEEHLREVNKLTRELQKKRHEFINYLESISYFLNVGDLDRARAFLQQVGINVTVSYQVKMINNPYMADVLNKFIIKTEALGVLFRFSLQGEMSAFPLSHIHTVTVFSNLLNNALENCPPADGYINLAICEGNNAYTITVSNNGPAIVNRDDIFRNGYSTKETGRGYGLGLIKDILDVYKGSISVTEIHPPTFNATIPKGKVRENIAAGDTD